jgi:hypothetical protein
MYQSHYLADDLKSLYGFLRATNENNLKKMLVGGKMTDTHINMLVKVVRAINEDEFVTHLEAGTFPKVKMKPEETALKETFWTVCSDACARMGLLTAAKKAA